MAITINNSANITYKYDTFTDYAASNVASTVLTENYSLNAEKLSNNTSWRPSENLTFSIKVENNGIEPLYGVSIQDNLGDNINRPLTYVMDSVKMFRNGTLSGIIPTNTEPLTLIIPDTLEPGEIVIFTYLAKVRSDIDSTITEITNEVQVLGHETSVSGPAVTFTPNPSITIPRGEYAEVRIEKNVDKINVSVDEPLTYTFLLENSGNIVANNLVITDNLPEKFVIESVISETNGIITNYETTDYSLDTNNKLILPTSITKTISVPSATISGNGVTKVTIVGKVTI